MSTPPRRNLPPDSEQWGRWIEEHLDGNERTIAAIGGTASLVERQAAAAADLAAQTNNAVTAQVERFDTAEEVREQELRIPSAVIGAPNVLSNVGGYSPIGLPVSNISLSWSPVSTGVDDGPITISHYEVWRIRPASESSESQVATTFDEAFDDTSAPGEESVYRVRAVSTNGIVGGFSPTRSVIGASATATVPTPSAPTLSSDLGILVVNHNGLTSTGAAFPNWVSSVRSTVSWPGQPAIEMGSSFSVGGGTNISGIPVGVTATVGLKATSVDGRTSPLGATQTVVIASVNAADIDAAIIDAIAEAQEDAATADTNASIALAAASAADANATEALTTANGKNKIVRSAAVASSPGSYVAGDLWYQYLGSQVIAMWLHSGSAWVQQTITDSVITNLNAATVTAGTFVGDRFSANSISVSKLIVSDMTNLVEDPNLTRPLVPAAGQSASWSTPYDASLSRWSIVSTTGLPGLALTIVANGQASRLLNANILSVVPGSRYAIQVRSQVTGWTGTVPSIRMIWRNSAGSPVRQDVYNVPNSGWSDSAWITPAAPADAVRGDFEIVLLNTSTAGQFWVGNFQWRRALTAELVVDGLIQAGSAIIADAAIDNAKISNLSGEKITAKSIAVRSLLVANMDNLIEDAEFAIPLGPTSPWSAAASGWSIGTSTAPDVDRYVQRSTGATASGASTQVNAYQVAVKPGEKYVLTCLTYHEGATSSSVGVVFFNAAGSGFVNSTIGITGSPGVWTERVHKFTVPANAFSMSVRFADNGVANTRFVIANPFLRRMADANLIVDGSITALALATNSVTSDAILAGSIDGMLITGATIQTTATANRGVMMNTTGLYGWDASGVMRFQLNAANGNLTATNVNLTGAITATSGSFTGAITATSGSITGALTVTGSLTGGTIQTTATANRGVTLNTAGLFGWNSSGVQTFSLNATTGALSATGATITGVVNATSGTFSGSITSTATITGGFFSGGRFNTTTSPASGSYASLDGGTLDFIVPSAGGGSGRVLYNAVAKQILIQSAGTLTGTDGVNRIEINAAESVSSPGGVVVQLPWNGNFHIPGTGSLQNGGDIIALGSMRSNEYRNLAGNRFSTIGVPPVAQASNGSAMALTATAGMANLPTSVSVTINLAAACWVDVEAAGWLVASSGGDIRMSTAVSGATTIAAAGGATGPGGQTYSWGTAAIQQGVTNQRLAARRMYYLNAGNNTITIQAYRAAGTGTISYPALIVTPTQWV